jgi:hypothetical protein
VYGFDDQSRLSLRGREERQPFLLEALKRQEIAIFELVGHSRDPVQLYSGVLHKVHFEGVISCASPEWVYVLLFGYYLADHCEVFYHLKYFYLK